MYHKIKIKEIRKSRGVSQKDLSYMVGLTQSRLSDIENMRCSINIDMLLKIAEALNVVPWWSLVDIDNNEKRNSINKYKTKKLPDK